MKLTLKVETREADGDNRIYQVDTDLYSVVMWERRFKRKSSNVAVDGIGHEDLAYLAWESSKINKIVVPVEFDSFLKKCVAVEIVAQEADDFTQPATDAG